MKPGLRHDLAGAVHKQHCICQYVLSCLHATMFSTDARQVQRYAQHSTMNSPHPSSCPVERIQAAVSSIPRLSQASHQEHTLPIC